LVLALECWFSSGVLVLECGTPGLVLEF
jgi:hypothetical protein